MESFVVVSSLDDEVRSTMSSNVTELLDTVIEEAYCNSTGWRAFHRGFRQAHGGLSILVCIFGCIANLLNLVVLTRRGMVSPTNAILTGLALADLLNMIEYIPYSLFMYIWRVNYTYAFALFILVHANFSQICHTISIWLTLTLAIWRYIAVGIPTQSVSWCTMSRAKWAIASAYFFSPLLSIPVYLGFSISPKTRANSTQVYYVADLSELAQANDMFLEKLNFWIYSVVIKLIPCIILTVVSYRLINALMEAKKRKAKLMGKRQKKPGADDTSEKNEADRTTRMLLAVLLLFLITEFPQGILGLLSGLLGNKFFKTCYTNLGDLMDFLALLNSAINFILYCSMSKKFRSTFVTTFGLQDFKLFNLRSRRVDRNVNNSQQHASPPKSSYAQIEATPL